MALADQFVASASNFLTGVVVGRVCAQEEFGLYMLGFSIVLIAQRLQGPLISLPFMVFSPRMDSEEKASYTGSTLVHLAGIALPSILALGLAGGVLSAGFGPDGLASVAWALCLSISFILLREYARNICFANLDFLTALIIDIIAGSVQIFGLLLFAAYHSLESSIIFLVIGVSSALASIFWIVRNFRNFSIISGRLIPDLVRNWNFGKWILASSFLFEVGIYIYPWVLTHFHGTAAAGVWAACFGAVAVTNPIVIGMVNHAGPEIAHAFSTGGATALRGIVYKTTGSFVLLLSPLALTLWFFGDMIVVFFYGAKYGGYGVVVSLLAADVLISPVRFTFARAIFSMERPDIEFMTNLIPIAVLFTFGVWAVRTHGPVGAAAAVLVSNLLLGVGKAVAYFSVLRIVDRSAES